MCCVFSAVVLLYRVFSLNTIIGTVLIEYWCAQTLVVFKDRMMYAFAFTLSVCLFCCPWYVYIPCVLLVFVCPYNTCMFPVGIVPRV